jgi:general secretion pathway protein G
MASHTVNGERVNDVQPGSRGFTLIELMVVMSVIALLLTIVVPRYFKGVDRAREAVLKEDLNQMRGAIDQFFADRGVYPSSLDELVERDYVRRIPEDPITESKTTWVIVAPRNADLSGVFDVKSGAPGVALDGSVYSDW